MYGSSLRMFTATFDFARARLMVRNVITSPMPTAYARKLPLPLAMPSFVNVSLMFSMKMPIVHDSETTA